MLNHDPYRLFVYDALKKDMPAHKQILSAKFLRVARTAEPAFIMHEYASAKASGSVSPGVRKMQHGGGYIAGELYEVSDALLHTLDTFKGVSRRIFMRDHAVRMDDGGMAHMYLRAAHGRIVQPAQYVHYNAQENVYEWRGMNHAY
jgi:gamma-glutamylcyclotransferase (GGCT)/AIG2-like uncharacterized protein YtfP